MRRIGFHLRIDTTLVDLVNTALNINVDFFQCFLTLRTAGRVLPLDEGDIGKFIQLRHKYFKEIYLHISYWVNLSTIVYNPHILLKKELELAKRLDFTHIIFHPGSAKGAKNKIDGINALACTMNKLIEEEPNLHFILENIAQDFPSIGGSLNDFKLFLEKIDKPEKIQFCIDTAHAYSFGYDLLGKVQIDKFVNEIEATIGIDKIALIHLNDISEKLGSNIDKHEVIGRGQIGEDFLKMFMLHERLKTIPILMEPPLMSEQDMKEEVEKVVDWIRKKEIDHD